MRKNAFTLIEVLLVLAIIGLVAVLTVPVLVTKITKDQYVAGLKKARNVLEEVQRKAQEQNGPMEDWDWTLSSKDSFEKYFKPHFDILKDCGTDIDDECFRNANEWKYLNDTDDTNSYNLMTHHNFVTFDGIAYSYYTYPSDVYPSRAGNFVIDVNGKKGPNIVGRDMFAFDIFRKAGIKPFGSLLQTDETQEISGSDVDNDALSGCNTNAAGWYCAAKVLNEGVVNY